jgi:hypothetical protein
VIHVFNNMDTPKNNKPDSINLTRPTTKIEIFSGHTPKQPFVAVQQAKPAVQPMQSNIVRGVDRTVIGDRVQGSHHTPTQRFTPTTPSKPASPPPAPPKKP